MNPPLKEDVGTVYSVVYPQDTVNQPVIAVFHGVRADVHRCVVCTASHRTKDLRSFVIRFDFESYVRSEIRFVVMVRFEIFESSALSIVIRKETIGGG